MRLCDPTGGQAVEVTRGNSWKAFPEWLQQHLAVFGQISRKEIVTNVSGVEESCCGIVIPIGVNSERGLVAAASDRPDFPDQIDQQLLSVAANNAATAFQNAFLINELRNAQEALRANEQELRKARDELEIKVAERTSELQRSAQELQRSEFYLAEGQRLAHTGSWALNPSGFFEYWSRELFQIYGLDLQRGAPTLEQYLATIHSQDRDFMAETVKRMCKQGSGCDVKKRIIRPDGAVRYVRCVGVPLFENGVLKMFLGTAMDVTEQEQLTQELQRREAYLAEAQRLSHTGSFGWKPDTGELVWSDETYRIFEYDRSVKLTIDSVVQRVHPQDRADLQKVIDGASRGATHFEHTYRLLLPDGRVKDVHALAHALQDASGNREFVGAVTDITERKRAEEDLRASERKYRHLVDTTPAFIHTALPDGSLDFLSRGWLEYGGLPQTDFLDWRWTAGIHPEDVEGFVDKWRAALASGEPFVAESRVRRADGEYRWFLQRNVPLRDETGKIVKWYGTGIDIEERKTAEGKIREQEAELRQIVDLAPQHIGVFGRDGSPLYANRATLEYLGVGIDRWRDETARYSLVHPDDRERFLGERKRRFLEGVPHEIEVRLLGHDGKFRWFLFRLNPLKDERGQISRWYGTAIDIDDRRQAEDRLRSENVALREEIDKASMFEEIVGTSAALKSVLSRIPKSHRVILRSS